MGCRHGQWPYRMYPRLNINKDLGVQGCRKVSLNWTPKSWTMECRMMCEGFALGFGVGGRSCFNYLASTVEDRGSLKGDP